MASSSCSRCVPVMALALVLLAGCASSRTKQVSPAEELRTAIEEAIIDQERRTEMLSLSDHHLEILDQLVAELKARRRTLEGLVADYSSDRESFQEFFTEYMAWRSELSKRALEVHLAMKEVASDEEWRSIEKAAMRLTTTMMSQTLATFSD